jgi:hypothetical protein
MQFKTKNTVVPETKITYHNNVITEVPHITFLELEIENTLSWNLHIENISKKLSRVCYTLRSTKPYMCFSSLIMIYYTLFHSVLNYGIIFWGTSSYSQKIFILQKRAVRIITGHRGRTSCRNLFKELKILRMKSQYIFSILLFVIKNRNLFITNYDNQYTNQTR